LVTGSGLWRKGRLGSHESPVLAMCGSSRFIYPPECAEGQKKGKMEPILMLAALSPEGLMGMAPLLIIFVIFYLLIFMPMKKRQKKVEQMITALKNGDRVITSSGIYGVVAAVKDKTFVLKIADQVKIEVAKNAITGLQGPDDNT
jgi:preprotein translocase subunit YajC